MKFGKDFKKQKVPEWTEAYVDYNGLKRILQDIRNFKRNKHPSTPLRASHVSNLESKLDIENQVISVNTEQTENSRNVYNTKLLVSPEEREENEIIFFERLDAELNKANKFYKDEVEKVIQQAALLNKQMDALIALRIKVMDPNFDGLNSISPEINKSAHSKITSPDRAETNEILGRVKISSTCDSPISTIKGVLKDTREKGLSYNREELKEVEQRLKLVFVEFYQKLSLIKHYSFMNLSAFSKILKKYEKVTSRSVARSYMKIVDNSYIGSSDEVTSLMERVENIFIKHFLNSNRREGMKLLRPKQKIEKHRITFVSGFFSGCSIALLVAVILLIEDRKLIHKNTATSYMNVIFPLYSFYIYIILHILVYAANIYFWRRYKINYPFIFGFKQGTELGYREVFLLSNGLAVLSLGILLVHLHIKMDSKSQHFETYIELLPLGLLIAVLAVTFWPFNIIYQSSRFFLIKCVFHCICAPLYRVTLPDFFLADQFTSQVQAIRSFEYYVCFYTWGKLSQRRTKCGSNGVYNAFYFIVAVIPYWFRFLQCVRRLFEEKDYVHGYNGLRYFLTIVAVIMRTASELTKELTWKVLAIVTSVIATIVNTYWDIVVDWGLLKRKSRNFLLRDKLLVSNKIAYIAAMVLDILFRFAWLQLILELDFQSLRGMTISTTFSCLEILRRGMWNFFRLENEHLNNVGKYRAFKSVPLPFSYYDDEDDDDDDIDKDE